MNCKIILIAILLSSNLVQAELYKEIEQQQEIEINLQSKLEKQQRLSLEAYKDVFNFANESTLNRDEQIKRLTSANEIWNEFIEKTCSAEALEAINTRAEHANTLSCMIEKYKDKEKFFKSLL